ncbi:MAG: ABC transporter substrate-binding protein, partial [Firmicutes bacterium]|nr:ABC transporter substrate-binding protein [Bacillota bacterium]
MKILKRSLSIILIVAMAAALLTGCGSTSQAPAEQKPADTKPAESQQPAAETAKPQEPAKTEEPAKTGTSEKTADPTPVNVGVLKGPTGMGAVKLMDDSESGVYPDYHFTLTSEPTDIVARLTNGELNIGALPTNVASNLYNKTNGAVRVIALNCLGVLCVLENGETVKTPADLKGRTIWCNGQGSNPEYMINYIVRKSGLEPGKDVDIQFGDPGEISAKMVSGVIDLCMLPVPAATAVLVKNQDVRKALDVAEEYEKAA